jgi:glutamyl-tRNA reductase
MAVPRDINTEGIIKEIEVIDLEELKKYLEDQKTDIEVDIPLAEKIISDEANIFEVWNEFQKDDYLGVFAEKIESIRLQLLDETKLQVSEDEQLLLDKFSRSLIHRMKSTINQTVILNDELQEK